MFLKAIWVKVEKHGFFSQESCQRSTEDPKMATGHWELTALMNALSLSHGKIGDSFLQVGRTKSSRRITGTRSDRAAFWVTNCPWVRGKQE